MKKNMKLSKEEKSFNRKLMAGAGTFLVAAGVIGTGLYASAYQGNPNVIGPNYTPERHSAMTKAFEENDYNAWKELMAGRGRVTQVINENNFSRFVEAHNLALAGKKDEANKIRTELGLGLRNGDGHGRGLGRGVNYNR